MLLQVLPCFSSNTVSVFWIDYFVSPNPLYLDLVVQLMGPSWILNQLVAAINLVVRTPNMFGQLPRVDKMQRMIRHLSCTRKHNSSSSVNSGPWCKYLPAGNISLYSYPPTNTVRKYRYSAMMSSVLSCWIVNVMVYPFP